MNGVDAYCSILDIPKIPNNLLLCLWQSPFAPQLGAAPNTQTTWNFIDMNGVDAYCYC
jgi:hypothetical protein